MKYNFTSGKELLEMCNEYNMSIHEICLEREVELSGLSKEEIRSKMQHSLNIMKSATEKAVEEDIKSVGGLIGGEAKKLTIFRNNSKSVCGPLMNKALVAAMGTMEVNASMGLIVAAPTAGSCGILPGAVVTIGKEYDMTDEQMLDALFAASAIGAIITRNATVAGAEGGCQAETGAAAAMAAAGVVEMMGGTPEQAIHAASHCLQNVMGLVCDPIAGLVEAPCQGRNAIGVANALISAELCLAGILNIIPFDETVEAMYKVGKNLPPELRETALGGVAATCTGCALSDKIFG
ncbi:L-serine ammonia-lyase, iron-sulfur-dependent, subunit alpha [Romboutsia ilealis]|uniref:L-serine dehydratase n=1 Tax=Romboutsia faecis TaxID=2764597 RepID=A0ABR7JL75_9FIRM|nr:L-serine ammonia-lyase, iron-sulfur-dependent, subunit alpha [Romboutsia faecis]MBC5995655.1 L-serine ammonia-lyase, iron-sulfur-dependent, subunit alpha [Romboutsia faecis]MRN23857.1 L-serine ammonia-lyase, iron-sulfur-dependent, subunit alpha [Romboutsia ilealis]